MSKLYKSKDGILFANEASRLKYELEKGLTVECVYCDGTGYTYEPVSITMRGKDHWGFPMRLKCPECNSTGYF